MQNHHLNIDAGSVACLSQPGSPNAMATRRNSVMQLSAKLEKLRGENIEDEPEKAEDEDEKKKKKKMRFMDKNGRCNIRQQAQEIRERYLRDFFTTMVDMRWRNNMLFYVATYVIAWSIFGLFWWLIAYLRGDTTQPEGLRYNNSTMPDDEKCVKGVDSYVTAFLFFIETETSIGYGHRAITEKCPEAIILFVIQALLGNILDAFMIGCIFIKISQPKNRAETLVFSDTCVIVARDRKYCLMFRVGNLRSSLIVQCRIRAKLVQSRQTQEGEFIALHQSDINVGFDTGADNLFLVTPMTICHEINEKSPFYDFSPKDLKKKFEIIVILEGIIESTGMVCQARTSYLSDEVVWGERFIPVLWPSRNYFRVDHSELSTTLKVDFPTVSSRQYEEENPDENQEKESQALSKLMGNSSSKKSMRVNLLNRQFSLPKSASGGIDGKSLKKSPSDINSDYFAKINHTTKRMVPRIATSSSVDVENPSITINSEPPQEAKNILSNRDDLENVLTWEPELSGK